MARLELEIKAELSHFEINAVIPINIGLNQEVKTVWFENVTKNQLQIMFNSLGNIVDKKNLIDNINILLEDEDLTEEKMRLAFEGLLPNLVDILKNEI